MEKDYAPNKGNEIYFFIKKLYNIKNLNQIRIGILVNPIDTWPYFESYELKPYLGRLFQSKIKENIYFYAKWCYSKNDQQNSGWEVKLRGNEEDIKALEDLLENEKKRIFLLEEDIERTH
ncbi:MAG: hypothetical protein QXX55_00465 [Candidatus Pacearchaeota archaeon]